MATPHIPSRVVRIGFGTGIIAATDTASLGFGDPLLIPGRTARLLPQGRDGAFYNFVITATEVVDGATLDVVIQHSIDALNWFTLITFTQLTATGVGLQTNTVAALPWVRLNDTVTGSPGTWTYTVDVDIRGRAY